MMIAVKREIPGQLVPAVLLSIALAACGIGDGGGNMMAAPGNALSEAQIEHALGPAVLAGAPAVEEPGADGNAGGAADEGSPVEQPRSDREVSEPEPADPQVAADEPVEEE